MAITYPLFSHEVNADIRHPSRMFHRKARPIKLTIVRGIPGSGKSTFAKKYAAANGHIKVIEPDDFWTDRKRKYEYHAELREVYEMYGKAAVTHELIIEKRPCVIADVFATRKDLQFFKDLCEMYEIPLEVFRMTGEFQNVHNVNEDDLKEMKISFESFDGEIIK